MPTAKASHTSLLNAIEDAGVVVSLVTVTRVIELTDTTVNVLATALGLAGVPKNGDKIAAYPNLEVTKRSVRLLDDVSMCDVEVTYEHLKNDNQSFGAPASGNVVGEIRAIVQQAESNTDINGVTVFVQHQFINDELNKNKLIKQSGKFTFFLPQKTISLRGIKETLFPWIIANQLIGSINSSAWQGGAIHEWMCTSVSWEIHDVSGKYRMNFEFQHNSETWNPTVIFIDEKRSRPPVDLIDGVGIKKIRKNVEADFEQIVGQRLQGG